MPRETVTITIRMQPEVVDRLDSLAEREHRSRSGQVAHLVSEGLRRREQRDPSAPAAAK